MSYQAEKLGLELKVLRRAKRLVRKGWCQGHEARDPQDVDCAADSIVACKWCALGSIARAVAETTGVSGEGHPVFERLVEELETALDDAGETDFRLGEWNDDVNRTAGDVVDVMTKVERRLRSWLSSIENRAKSRKTKARKTKAQKPTGGSHGQRSK